jgi:hypothetical protein
MKHAFLILVGFGIGQTFAAAAPDHSVRAGIAGAIVTFGMIFYFVDMIATIKKGHDL